MHHNNNRIPVVATLASIIVVALTYLPAYYEQQKAYACGGPNAQCIEFVGAGYGYSSYSPHYWLYNLYYDWVYNQYGNLDHITADKYWWYSYNGYPGTAAGKPYYYWGDQTYMVCSDNPYYHNVPYCGSV